MAMALNVAGILAVCTCSIGLAAVPAGWTLAWSDEFGGNITTTSSAPVLPSTMKWGNEVGMIRNNEVQYYTREDLDNSWVKDGALNITARKEEYLGAHYTSASLVAKTADGARAQDFLYGRFEIRAKMPLGLGAWPALWTHGSNIDAPGVGWPRSGEIDIMEYVGIIPNVVHGGAHYGTNSTSGHGHTGSTVAVSNGALGAYHVYAVDWTADRIDWYFDDIKYHSFDINAATTPESFRWAHRLKISYALGGTWGGPTIDDSALDQSLSVDYVRFYQAPIPEPTCMGILTIAFWGLTRRRGA